MINPSVKIKRVYCYQVFTVLYVNLAVFSTLYDIC